MKRFGGPASDLQIQNSLGWGPAICILTSFLSDSGPHWNLGAPAVGAIKDSGLLECSKLCHGLQGLGENKGSQGVAMPKGPEALALDLCLFGHLAHSRIPVNLSFPLWKVQMIVIAVSTLGDWRMKWGSAGGVPSTVASFWDHCCSHYHLQQRGWIRWAHRPWRSLKSEKPKTRF